ncbi:septum formation family protein [Streptoalloteichus hindustanus]|uniref:Septum formation n=1 Tax=Streptoalloteichus hindustanus TaxID=2017 RepID=A0A1M4USE8_STRHI|nr:septum formation family protein [Streptoalloteichus hindustanus]SHE59609.1 Septum formation [Streptoalloteichus hindustanus]
MIAALRLPPVPAVAAVLVTVLATGLVGGCTGPVSGTPTAGTRESGPASGQTSGPATPTSGMGAAPPRVGACVRGAEYDEVACDQPHEGEVTATDTLPATLPATPDESVVRQAALPRCRQAAVGYLGSGDVDATRLRSWAFWPSARDWAAGQRWLVCAVFEAGPDDRPVARTGSLHGALANGLDAYQQCAAGSPSRDDRLVTVPCDQPHLAEAVPGVLALGAPHDPPPSPEQMTQAAQPHCAQAVTGYVGAARPDVLVSWRLPSPASWSEGFSVAVCYVETTTAVKSRLRGIGTNPLPS